MGFHSRGHPLIGKSGKAVRWRHIRDARHPGSEMGREIAAQHFKTWRHWRQLMECCAAFSKALRVAHVAFQNFAFFGQVAMIVEKRGSKDRHAR
jgi:hypothetical protein